MKFNKIILFFFILISGKFANAEDFYICYNKNIKELNNLKEIQEFNIQNCENNIISDLLIKNINIKK